MFLTRLDVVNEMLASMGEAQLNTEDDTHPLYPQGSRMLDTAAYRMQGRGWWFNTELVELTPDAESKYIYLPEDTIRVDPREPCLDYVQRGRRLYAPYASATKDKYKFDRTVQCWLVRYVPFEDLPGPAAIAISYAAQVDFQRAFDADPVKYQQLVMRARESEIHLNAENIRNVGANLLQSASVQGKLNRIGPRYPGMR